MSMAFSREALSLIVFLQGNIPSIRSGFRVGVFSSVIPLRSALQTYTCPIDLGSIWPKNVLCLVRTVLVSLELIAEI